MTTQIRLGDLCVDIQFKDIKNVHLSVHPPHGRVTVSAPARMDLDAIRLFAVTKIGWIRKQRRKVQQQARETRREVLDNESHFVWGKRYLLRVREDEKGPCFALSHAHLTMRVEASATAAKRKAMLSRWYRKQIEDAVPELLERWCPIVGVAVERVRVQRMKTKWGSCNHRSRSILLNTELAKKPQECLEYVIVHELAHLIEHTHNKYFTAVMDRVMPNWRVRRDLLNDLPVSHEDWKA